MWCEGGEAEVGGPAAWLHALAASAGQLREAAHADLLKAALAMDLWTAPADACAAYVHLCGACAAASGAWVPLLVDACVGLLVPPELRQAAMQVRLC